MEAVNYVLQWIVPIDQLLKKVASELQELQNYEEVDNTKTTKIQFLARQLQRNFPQYLLS